ncbi:unnamed protein product, partial [Heligmosomoides polygyrus]|uniref:Fructose-bisphosphatase n=1 Tax=Heligmosomoides polygyrus TaxID=6339 RepID=A0A183GS46_HELPZ
MEKNHSEVRESEQWGKEDSFVVKASEEVRQVIDHIREISDQIKNDLEEARIAPKYRTLIDRAVANGVKMACEELEELRKGAETHLTFGRGMIKLLKSKGIETLEDMQDFFAVVERDGDLIAQICATLKTDVLQVIDQKLLEPAFDASNNKMTFLGGVVIPVFVDGWEAEVAFYISKDKRQEIILGTNALRNLGVKVTWSRKIDGTLIPAYCDVEEELVDLVVWSSNDAIAPGVFRIQDKMTGAVIDSKECKGHLEYQCKEDCMAYACFGDLEGIHFPGAFSKEPIGSLWRAWNAASIFMRSDMNTAQKIKAWKEGLVCLDGEALRKVLRLAYQKCMDWTEFVMITDGIRRHEKIDDYRFEETYDDALKKLKLELEEQERKQRPQKEGPTAFAASENALLLERDGSRRGILT